MWPVQFVFLLFYYFLLIDCGQYLTSFVGTYSNAGEDMFVTDRRDSSSSRHSRETARTYIQTLVKQVLGAVVQCMLRRHWGRAVTMAI